MGTSDVTNARVLESIHDKFGGKEIVSNANGGQQSKAEGRFDLVPGEAIIRMAKIVEYGAQRYPKNNWRRITMAEHLNHAEQHIQLLKAGDTSEDHLGHALTRLAFAVAMEDPSYDFRAEDKDVQGSAGLGSGNG